MSEEPTPATARPEPGGVADLHPVRRKASFAATMKAVFWSFFGVRKRSDYERDADQLNPVHVLIAGVIGALLFIGFLVTVVKVVVSK